MSLPIATEHARFIKLGPGNAWFRQCRDNGWLGFGHRQIAHELAEARDEAAIVASYLETGRSPSKARDFAREIGDFYNLGADCLWVTIADGSLWWAFAEPEVEMLNLDPAGPVRIRRVIGAWSNTDADGQILALNTLSTRLTKVAAYRQTLCRIEAQDYLLRRINGEDEPTVAAAKLVQESMLDVTRTLIAELHWRDFEVLCDLIFARSGWQRIAEIGGLQKDTDLVLDQAASGERAFVQIKSEADQVTLAEYTAAFEADASSDRMFFCCHSPKGRLEVTATKPVHVWAGDELARQAIAAGLFDWLITKAQ